MSVRIKEFCHKVPVWVWYILAALIPFFVTMFRLFFVVGENTNLFHSFPIWNDEGLWWHQIGAMAKYGRPLGYFGYNATHAQVGRYGPWGVAILFPYAVFGKIFGWHYNSMALANMFFLCLANLIFLLLTRMEKKNIKWFVLCNITSYLTIYYANTSMSEPLRFSLGIILAGMMYRLFLLETGKIYKYVVVPLVLLYCINAYVPFVLFIPFYIFGIRQHSSLKCKLIISFFVTVVTAFVVNGITTMLSSPFIGSTITDIMEAFHEGFKQGIIMFFNNFFSSLLEADLTSVIALVSQGNLIGLFDMTYYMLVILLAVDLAIKMRKGEKMEYVDRHTCIFCLFLLVSFILIFAAFYSTDAWTYVRGLNVAFCAATYLLVNCGDKRIFMILTLSFIMILPRVWVTYNTSRYPTDSTLEYYDMAREELGECVQLFADSSNPWENTCGIYGYGYDPYFITALPVGLGINFIFDDNVYPHIKYAVVCGTEFNDAIVERLQTTGFYEVWTDGRNALYVSGSF